MSAYFRLSFVPAVLLMGCALCVCANRTPAQTAVHAPAPWNGCMLSLQLYDPKNDSYEGGFGIGTDQGTGASFSNGPNNAVVMHASVAHATANGLSLDVQIDGPNPAANGAIMHFKQTIFVRYGRDTAVPVADGLQLKIHFYQPGK